MSLLVGSSSDVPPDERSALLASTRSDTAETELASEQEATSRKKVQSAVLALCCIMIVIIDFGTYLGAAPQTQIFEDIVCDNYYHNARTEVPQSKAADSSSFGNSASPAHDCSVAPVQGELAIIIQILGTIETIPGIVLAIPYGILADRWGRKAVLSLSLLGLVLADLVVKVICWFPDAFPLRLVWLAPIMRVVGGGDQVAASMVFTMVADVFEASERANVFYLLTASVLVADVMATPLSALLMQRGPWFPFLLAFGLICVGILPPLILLPETLPPHKKSSIRNQSETLDEPSVSPATKQSSVAARTKQIASSIWASTGFLFRSRNLAMLLMAYFVSQLGRQSTSFQLQYTRKRFHWSYARASLLISLRGVINLVLLLGLLPLLGKALSKLGLPAPIKDIYISRGSAMLATIGCLLMAVAPNVWLLIGGIVIMALGYGQPIHIRSLATSLIEPDQVGTLYTGMAVMQGAGMLCAGPLLAITFQWSLQLSESWQGLPFLFVAGLFAFGTAALYGVSIMGEERRDIDQ